jgi:predicted permease
LVAGLGNTSFIGYPLIAAVRGPEALPHAVIADQLGTFVMLALGGAVVAATYAGTRVSAGSIAKKVARFPPFVALVMSFVATLIGEWPAAIDAVLKSLGDTLIPLALFSVGLQLRFARSRGQASTIALALLWKLALAPAIVFVLGALTGIARPLCDIGVLQAAMAPMVTATILADESNLEPELANIILGLGTVISFGTVPLIALLL